MEIINRNAYHEYVAVIKNVFNSSSFMYLKVASGKCYYLRRDWVIELFEDKLPEKQLEAVILYLSDNKHLNTILNFDKKLTIEERDRHIERIASWLSLGLGIQ